jgi:hypothetical protein
VTFSTFTELLDNEGVAKYLKKNDLWKTTGRGENRGVVCDGEIWWLIALEMSPQLRVMVARWLNDSLVPNRIEAGDTYKEMCKAINMRHMSLKGKEAPVNLYIEEARMIKSVLDVDRERNKQTQGELNKIVILQKLNTLLLNEGYNRKKRYPQLVRQLKLL